MSENASETHSWIVHESETLNDFSIVPPLENSDLRQERDPKQYLANNSH